MDNFFLYCMILALQSYHDDPKADFLIKSIAKEENISLNIPEQISLFKYYWNVKANQFLQYSCENQGFLYQG